MAKLVNKVLSIKEQLPNRPSAFAKTEGESGCGRSHRAMWMIAGAIGVALTLGLVWRIRGD